MVEEERNIREIVQLIKKSLVETCTIDGADELTLMSACLMLTLGRSYSSMCVVLLRLFEDLTMGRAVNHATMHRDCFCENSVQQTWTFCLTQRIDATFG